MEDGIWTYPMDAVRVGSQDIYQKLATNVFARLSPSANLRNEQGYEIDAISSNVMGGAMPSGGVSARFSEFAKFAKICL